MSVHQVVSTTVRNKVLFEGTQEDAEDYVRQNFPRNHQEPGSSQNTPIAADVAITADGRKTHKVLHDGEFVAADEYGVRKPKTQPVAATPATK